MTALRSYLATQLPPHAVPSTIMPIDALPLTPSGKVDRRALPEPNAQRPELESCFVAPRTPAEELLAGIWSEVLGLFRVGIHDNFFELGGHSLLGAQVISRLRDALGIELPLRFLFESPTVSGLVEAVHAAASVLAGRHFRYGPARARASCACRSPNSGFGFCIR